MGKWIPINDHPGDQRYDHVPGTVDASYWGEIGPDGEGRWNWTIIGRYDDGSQDDVDSGSGDTEAEVKAAVQAWRPRGVRRKPRRRANEVIDLGRELNGYTDRDGKPKPVNAI